jgi:hypothetical protein
MHIGGRQAFRAYTMPLATLLFEGPRGLSVMGARECLEDLQRCAGPHEVHRGRLTTMIVHWRYPQAVSHRGKRRLIGLASIVVHDSLRLPIAPGDEIDAAHIFHQPVSHPHVPSLLGVGADSRGGTASYSAAPRAGSGGATPAAGATFGPGRPAGERCLTVHA